jgi:lipoyl-dependent peroxiredoxin subunit D
MTISNETSTQLLEVLGFEQNNLTSEPEAAASLAPKYLRELKLNLKGVLKSDHLSEKETMLLALCLATNSRNQLLEQVFRTKSLQAGASQEQIAEAIACASMMASNNVLYRFRHYMKSEIYDTMPARFRMNLMISPVNGKEFFELMSIAVSAVNGCQMCVVAHENSLRELGCSPQRIFDTIRLASIMQSIDKLL